MKSHGLNFEQHEISATFRTLGRTVSETDIVNFVNLCGFTEPLFMDMEYVARESVFKRRAAPGPPTFALAAGQVFFAVNFVYSLFFGKRASKNPWEATTLEWATASPPPHENFEKDPTVIARPHEYGAPGAGPAGYLPQWET